MTISSSSAMSVDIRLCGNIPRREMNKMVTGAPCALQSLHESSLSVSCLAGNNGPSNELPTHRTIGESEIGNLFNNLSNMRGVLQEKQPLAQLSEPPTWAVPARGETRLEPACDTVGRQAAIDLASKASFRVGRSPNSDVQLHHATSSRRHAMLFHHSNGHCYIVDCGSAHGTFVNGTRLTSPAKGAVIMPHRVRRGALIRFGGPGAPSFVLKSFSFALREVHRLPSQTLSMGDMVRRNTRLNALGQSSRDCAMFQDYEYTVCRKRSFDSLASGMTMDEEEPSGKRIRCSSPQASPEPPLRLVSPDFSVVIASRRRVSFSPDPPQIHSVSVAPAFPSAEDDQVHLD